MQSKNTSNLSIDFILDKCPLNIHVSVNIVAVNKIGFSADSLQTFAITGITNCTDSNNGGLTCTVQVIAVVIISMLCIL